MSSATSTNGVTKGSVRDSGLNEDLNGLRISNSQAPEKSSDGKRSAPKGRYVPPSLRSRQESNESGFDRSQDKSNFRGRDGGRPSNGYRRDPPPQLNDRMEGLKNADYGRQQRSYGQRSYGGGSRYGGERQEPPFTREDFAAYEKLLRKEAGEEVSDDEGEGKVNTSGIDFDAYDNIPVETSGNDVPEPIKLFADSDLGDIVNRNVKLARYVRPTPVQRYAIPIVLNKRDLMACAQTGSGKTAAFLTPVVALLLNEGPSIPPQNAPPRKAYPSALCLAPTRELAMQIHQECRKFAYDSPCKTACIYGGAKVGPQLRDLERGCDVLIATPGRLIDMIERGRVGLACVRFLILDEADRMLDMGFEDDMRRIVEREDMPSSRHRQTLMFSATFPRDIQMLATDFLYDYVFVTVGRVGSQSALIEQRVLRVAEHDKSTMIIDLLGAVEGMTLVFVETKRGADMLADHLYHSGFSVTSIHGDRVQEERTAALKQFRSGRARVLVATSVASRGLDIPNVAHVVNYDMPNDIDDYTHRIGRTGRAGKKGLATAFFNEKNAPVAGALRDSLAEAGQDVPDFLGMFANSRGGGRRGGGRRGNQYGGRDIRRGNFNNKGGNNGYSGGNGGYSGYGGNGGGYGGNGGGYSGSRFESRGGRSAWD